jgi:hypothetical protein
VLRRVLALAVAALKSKGRRIRDALLREETPVDWPHPWAPAPDWPRVERVADPRFEEVAKGLVVAATDDLEDDAARPLCETEDEKDDDELQALAPAALVPFRTLVGDAPDSRR